MQAHNKTVIYTLETLPVFLFVMVKSLRLMVKSKARCRTKTNITVRTIIAGPLHLASVIANFASPF